MYWFFPNFFEIPLWSRKSDFLSVEVDTYRASGLLPYAPPLDPLPHRSSKMVKNKAYLGFENLELEFETSALFVQVRKGMGITKSK